MQTAAVRIGGGQDVQRAAHTLAPPEQLSLQAAAPCGQANRGQWAASTTQEPSPRPQTPGYPSLTSVLTHRAVARTAQGSMGPADVRVTPEGGVLLSTQKAHPHPSCPRDPGRHLLMGLGGPILLVLAQVDPVQWGCLWRPHLELRIISTCRGVSAKMHGLSCSFSALCGTEHRWSGSLAGPPKHRDRQASSWDSGDMLSPKGRRVAICIQRLCSAATAGRPDREVAAV